MPGLGLARCGVVRRTLARRGVRGRGLARRGVRGRGLARRGVRGRTLVRRGVRGRGLARRGVVRRGLKLVVRLVGAIVAAQRHSARIGLATGTLGLALAACGGSATTTAGTTPSQVVARSAAQTIDAGTARLVFSLQLEGVSVRNAPSGALPLIVSPNEKLAGVGEFDLRSGTGFFTLDTPNFGGPLELFVLGGAFYLEFPPALRTGPLAGTSWVRVDMATFGSVHSLALAAVGELLAAIDPAVALGFLAGAERTVNLGPGQVDGVPTTRYATVINLERAARRTRGVTSKLIAQAERVLHIATQPLTLWIDHEGRLRKSRFTVQLSDVAFPVPGSPLESERLSGEIVVTHVLPSFTSQPFHASAPPRSQVRDLSTLIKAAGL
jgi:hypothetical protein